MKHAVIRFFIPLFSPDAAAHPLTQQLQSWLKQWLRQAGQSTWADQLGEPISEADWQQLFADIDLPSLVAALTKWLDQQKPAADWQQIRHKWQAVLATFETTARPKPTVNKPKVPAKKYKPGPTRHHAPKSNPSKSYSWDDDQGGPLPSGEFDFLDTEEASVLPDWEETSAIDMDELESYLEETEEMAPPTAGALEPSGNIEAFLEKEKGFGYIDTPDDTKEAFKPPAAPGGELVYKATIRNETEKGRIEYDLPDQMAVGEKTRCRFLIAKGSLAPEDHSRPAEDIRVGSTMEVALKDTSSPPNFHIAAVSNTTQEIEEQEYTVWIFDVTPLKPGAHGLSLVVTIKTGGKEKDIVVLEKIITVTGQVATQISELVQEVQRRIANGRLDAAIDHLLQHYPSTDYQYQEIIKFSNLLKALLERELADPDNTTAHNRERNNLITAVLDWCTEVMA